jgi:TusA-related sulfurtransferase
MATMTIDCRGLSCPMPIVKVSRAMKQLASGDTLTIAASDAAFRADLEAWVKKLGHVLVTFADGPEQIATVRKV